VGDALEVPSAAECAQGRPCRIQTATFSVVPLDSSASLALFSHPPEIDFATGALTFSLGSFAFGNVSFAVTLSDSDGASSDPVQLTITVHRRNFPPAFGLTHANVWVPPFLSTSHEVSSLFTGVQVGPPAANEEQNYTVTISCPTTASNYIASGPSFRHEDFSLVLTTRPTPPLTNEEMTCSVTMQDTGGSTRHAVPEVEYFADARAQPDDEADELTLRIGFSGSQEPAGVVGQGWATMQSPADGNTFSARSMHAMVAYDGARGEYEGSVWVLGGYYSPPQDALPAWVPPSRRLLNAPNSSQVLSDVWRIDQGGCIAGDSLASCTNFTLVTASAQWPARHSHSGASYAGRMWLLGGAVGGAAAGEDVWSTYNGADWTLEAAVGGFGARMGASLVPLVRDGEGSDRHMLILAGGMAQTGQGEIFFGDVWGASWSVASNLTWKKLSSSPGFTPRAFHGASSTNFNGQPQVWLSGGFQSGLVAEGDVWSTSDGVTWTLESAQPPFKARAGHSMSYCRGKLYMVGGIAGSGGDVDSAPYLLQDAWAYDSSAWASVSDVLPFSSRESAAMACSGGERLVLSGGQNPDVGILDDLLASPCDPADPGCSQ
jgi:hypothetical protein